MSLYEGEQLLVGVLYLLYISPGAAAIHPKACCVVFNFFGPYFLASKRGYGLYQDLPILSKGMD